jgi:tRNA(Glu) U13 pseudouridine synthase TruD
VLRPRVGEGEEAREARVWWVEKGDAKGALARMPRGMGIEVAVLRAYERNGKDAHLNAIQVREGGREGGRCVFPKLPFFCFVFLFP